MSQEPKYIVRILNTDLEGKKELFMSLQKIKGVGPIFSNAICRASKIDLTKKTGLLSDGEINKLNEVLKNPAGFNIPEWIFNRKKDYETGNDIHIYGSDLDFTQMNDRKRLQKIKSYRGLRLAAKLPVRGQRTKSNFRHGKSLGVSKKGKK